MYKPEPLDTSDVALPEELRNLTEWLAQNTHNLWAQKRMADGWTYGPHRNDVTKKHPGLVPYSDLSVSEQDYDRTTAMEALKAIIALGYRIEKPNLPPISSADLTASPYGEAVRIEPAVEHILTTLHEPSANVLDLLHTYQDDAYRAWWQQDVRLYRAFGKKLTEVGHPTKAFELVREGLFYHWDDPELLYISALALRRGGNVTKAMDDITTLLKNHALDQGLQIEALSLAGALNKVRYHRTSKPTRKTRFAQESAQLYERAHQLSGDWFPGINAATMTLLAGRRKQARDLATLVVSQAKAGMSQSGREHNYWCFATLGEAYLILGDLTAAASWYRQAVHFAAGRISDIASMHSNIELLRQKVEVSDEILQLFSIGSVVAFSGHMIDHPGRQAAAEISPRFPPDPEIERHVSLAIQGELERLQATIGYCSAACGADLLFAECMLERGAELHIVLPFDKQDFYVTSVDYGVAEMSRWRTRCDDVLARATEVHYADRENFLGDDVLFEFANTFTQGLAITRAAQLGAESYALVVLDPAANTHIGGTGYFITKWNADDRETHIIDLAAIRSVSTSPVSVRHIEPPQQTVHIGTMKRQIKAMLFADVKNFSKLREAQSPAFFIKFLKDVTGVMRASKVKPTFCNTWGDGLYLVYDSVVDCADFAMRLLDRMAKVDWEAMGLPADTTVRMGLHAGPVYRQWDPIIGRHNFFGSHVNRAARIEPVTTPGCAFTSEQFAAALMLESGHRFVCEYVGVENLAKDYDRCPLYRLSHRE